MKYIHGRDADNSLDDALAPTYITTQRHTIGWF
jgi:hypothetical protein